MEHSMKMLFDIIAVGAVFAAAFAQAPNTRQGRGYRPERYPPTI
jgi:hypothetical protein